MSKTLKNTLLLTSVQNAREKNGVPDRIKIYVFGSAVYHTKPRDVDLLFIYDETQDPPNTAYSKIRPMLFTLAADFETPIHPIILSKSELAESEFMDIAEPVLVPNGA